MSPSPPYELVVGAIAAGTVATVLAIAMLIASWFLQQRQLEILRYLVVLRGNVETNNRELYARTDGLAEQTHRLTTSVVELLDIRTELRRHATSSILHPERVDVP